MKIDWRYLPILAPLFITPASGQWPALHIGRAIADLAIELAPLQERLTYESIFEELKKQPLARLYFIKSVPDPCKQRVFECKTVPPEVLKTMIEGVIADIQTERALDVAGASANTAKWSLGVSFGALLVSLISLFVKSRDTKNNSPSPSPA
jgi:hypothetical protein